jgi:hypothetical protein
MSLQKDKALELLCSLEGYHQALKMMHWSTDNHSKHLLTDEIDGDVLEFEDELAEVVMGTLGEKFGKGDLKTMLPEAEELKGMLDELEGDVNKFIDSIGGEHGYGGIYNVTDDFLSKICKWKYLETLS